MFRVPFWMPVLLPQAAAILRAHGHETSIVDRDALARAGRGDPRRILKSFEACVVREQPDLIVFDVRAESWVHALDMMAAAKSVLSEVLILAVGRLPALCPGECLENTPELDGVIAGEPEFPLLKIAGGCPLHQVDNVACRRDGRIQVNPRTSRVEMMDEMPLPAWDGLDMAFYTKATPRVIPCIPLRVATLETSRGCGRQCSFCAEGRLYDAKHRFHSAGYVADALRKLIADYRINGIYFSDESFLNHRDRVQSLCGELIRSGLSSSLRWAAQVRCDSIDPEILRLMAQAGCIQLEIGVESGSQRLLDGMSKGSNVEQNEAAVRLCREAGIRSMAYLMYGLPEETASDLAGTERWIESARPDIIRWNRFIPYPGTPAIPSLQSRGRLKLDFWTTARTPKGWMRYRNQNASDMSDPDLRRGARRIYRRHVLPRLVSDSLRHQSPAALLRTMNPGQLAVFFARKIWT